MAWEHVPGETPLEDVSGLIPDGVTSRAELSRLEARNILGVVLKYLETKPSRRKAPFTYEWRLLLHKEMFGKVWRWAGRMRKTELNLGVPHRHIQQELSTLLGDLVYWREHQSDLFLQAAMLHHRAVFIHPFLNGNGRWARMLATILLKQAGISETWPNEVIDTTSAIRGEYLAAIRMADQGDYSALVALHRRYSLTPKENG